ncbi:MAG: hypothetical protein Q4C55_00360 [Eubacterium sp.]|nr:hypothetical protein [Eubacterium sp.]
MKFIRYTAVLLAVIFLYTGCSAQKLDTDQLAALIFERVVGGQPSEEFENSFAEADALDALVAQREDEYFGILDSFVKSIGAAWSEDQSAALAEAVKAAAAANASYEITAAKTERDGSVRIDLGVTGLNFSEVLKQATTAIYAESEANPGLKYDAEALGAAAAEVFNEALAEAEALPSPIAVTITLRQKGEKAVLAEADQKGLDALILSAFFGVENEEDYIKAIQAAKMGVWQE